MTDESHGWVAGESHALLAEDSQDLHHLRGLRLGVHPFGSLTLHMHREDSSKFWPISTLELTLTQQPHERHPGSNLVHVCQ